MNDKLTFQIIEDLEEMGFSKQQVIDIINVFCKNKEEFSTMINAFNKEHGIKESINITKYETEIIN